MKKSAVIALTAMFLYAASADAVVAQEAKDCSQERAPTASDPESNCKIVVKPGECTKEKAIEVTQVDPAITTLCGRSLNNGYNLCSFTATKPSSGSSWIVTVASARPEVKFSVTDKISDSCQVIEDMTGCTAEKAIEAAKANPAVARFCAQTIYGPNFKCEFRAGKSAIYPLGEKSDPGRGWLVNALTFKMSAFTKVSEGCRVTRHPFFVNTVEVGSIELGVLESKDIVIGKVVDVQGPPLVMQNGGAKIQAETVKVDVSKVLKGESVSKITFSHDFAFPESSAKRLWLGDGKERLFFISRGRLIGMKDDYTCQGKADTTSGSDTKKNLVFLGCAAEVITDNKASDEGKPVLLGIWPNGIDLETGRDWTPYPVFSKSGDILKTKAAILDAVQSELAREADNLPNIETLRTSYDNKIELSADKYPAAYAAGIRKGSVVVLDVPKE